MTSSIEIFDSGAAAAVAGGAGTAAAAGAAAVVDASEAGAVGGFGMSVTGVCFRSEGEPEKYVLASARGKSGAAGARGAPRGIWPQARSDTERSGAFFGA